MPEHIYGFMALAMTGIPLGVGAYMGWEFAELVFRLFRAMFRAKAKGKGKVEIKIEMTAAPILRSLRLLVARLDAPIKGYNDGDTEEWRELAEARSTIDEAEGKPHHD